ISCPVLEQSVFASAAFKRVISKASLDDIVQSITGEPILAAASNDVFNGADPRKNHNLTSRQAQHEAGFDHRIRIGNQRDTYISQVHDLRLPRRKVNRKIFRGTRE